MQIILDYDPDTGQISSDGMNLTLYMGLEGKEFKEPEVDESTLVDNVVKLRTAGFTAEEIVTMSSRKII